MFWVFFVVVVHISLYAPVLEFCAGFSPVLLVTEDIRDTFHSECLSSHCERKKK